MNGLVCNLYWSSDNFLVWIIWLGCTSLTVIAPSLKHAIGQWCTTSSLRATSGPQRVVKLPAMSNRISDFFRTSTDDKFAVAHTALLHWTTSQWSEPENAGLKQT